MLGVTSGKKIFEKICQSEAPRSLAASKTLFSIFLNPKNIIKLEKGAVRAACAKNILKNPNLRLANIKSINRLTAKIISGKTIIDWMLKNNNFLPGNRYLYIANELNTPNTIESIEEVIASINEFFAAINKLVLEHKFLYHCRVNPSQLIPYKDKLNEFIVKIIIGAYNRIKKNVI